MKKKLITLTLAMTMVLGMTVTAFAADAVIQNPDSTSKTYKQDITVTNSITTPTIKITVPTAAAVALNPYKIKTTVGENANATTQIVSDKYTIKNESNVAINCNATAKAAPASSSGVVLATAALKGTETTKSVLLYLEVKGTSGYATAYDAKSANMLLLGTKDATKKAIATLAEGSSTATTAEYTFNGQVATTPATAWAAEDKLDVTLTWQFEPVLPTE